MKKNYYSVVLLFLITFTGCSSNNKTVQIPQSNSNDKSIEIYGKNIILDDKLKAKYIKIFYAKYEFYPKNNLISVKNKKAGYFVNYNPNRRPEYIIELDKPMIIKNIKYVSDYSFANNPVDGIFKGVSAVIGTPFSLLNKTLDSNTPLLPSIAEISIFKHNGKKYEDGTIYEFSIDESDRVIINNPFNSNTVQKIAITVNKSWMPLTYTVNKTMTWNPGKIQIEAIDMSDFFGILDYALKNGNNKDENEDIIFAILQKDEALFKKLKNNSSQYNLPLISFFKLPEDVNLIYAKNNKDRIFEEGIYKNNQGKFIKLFPDEIVFNTTNKVEVKVKTLTVDNEKIKYNKRDQKNEAKYIDFSDGI